MNDSYKYYPRLLPEPNSVGYTNDPARFFHVVGANDVGAGESGSDGGSETALQPLVRNGIQDSADERLARSADEQRLPEARERG